MFKIGDKVRVKEGKENKCGSYTNEPGAHHLVVIGGENNGKLRYDIMDKEGTKINWCFNCFDDEDLVPYQTEITLETLQKGNVVIDGNGYEYAVILRIEDNILLSSDDNHQHAGYWYTIVELKDDEYTTKPVEPEKTEVTLEEIADKMGIPLENLRIKD